MTAKNPASQPPPWRAFLFIPVALSLACFVAPRSARAVFPPPGGGYPNENTAVGDDALFSLTIGIANTASGFQALYSNTEGSFNTANGRNALYSNTTGGGNTAIGSNGLYSNTTGTQNTASGAGALGSNTIGFQNTADGNGALTSNTTGIGNTASGISALFYNQTGSDNTAIGAGVLSNNISGHDNTAVGGAALQANGVGALSTNTTGSFNTAIGMSALGNNTIGYNNTAIGVDAMVNSSTGKFNVALGNMAGSGLTTGSYNVDIGSPGLAGESNTIRIGTTGTHRTMVMAGITDATIPEGAAVVINRHGRMGVRTSSLRFNEAVKPMANASEVLLSLQPMTFRYKKELDPDAIPQFGLVAEQVAEIAPDLVARDDEGKAYTVRYEAVNAMLLNEFLKEHRKVEQLNETVSTLQKDLAQQRNEFVSLVAEQQKLQRSLATFGAGGPNSKGKCAQTINRLAPRMAIANQ